MIKWTLDLWNKAAKSNYQLNKFSPPQCRQSVELATAEARHVSTASKRNHPSAPIKQFVDKPWSTVVGSKAIMTYLSRNWIQPPLPNSYLIEFSSYSIKCHSQFSSALMTTIFAAYFVYRSPLEIRVKSSPNYMPTFALTLQLTHESVVVVRSAAVNVDKTKKCQCETMSRFWFRWAAAPSPDDRLSLVS